MIIRFITKKVLFTLMLFLPLSARGEAFNIDSNALFDEGLIPVLYTCDGKNISPKISWANAPKKTKAYAVTLSDEDNSHALHWVLYNIPINKKELPENSVNFSDGTQFGKNHFNEFSYNGPCPPKGTSHNYTFTIFALDNMLTLPKEADEKFIIDTINKHTLGKATLSSVYSRWPDE